MLIGLLRRRGRTVLVLTAAAACLVAAIGLIAPSTWLGVAAFVAAVPPFFVLSLEDHRKRAGELLVTHGTFATPLGVGSRLTAMSILAGLISCLVLGVDKINGFAPYAAWLSLLAVLVVPLASVAWGAWHGTGVTLTPEGLRAVKHTGTVLIPWTALTADQPGQDPDGTDRGTMFLGLSHPDLVRTAGRPIDADRVIFAGTERDFLASAVRHYAAHPEDRAAIGTPAGYERLRAALADTPPPVDPDFRRPHRVRDRAIGVPLLLLAPALWFWTSWQLDPFGTVESMSHLAALPGVAGLALLLAPVRLTPPPTPPQPPKPSRPSWSRDVTDQ